MLVAQSANNASSAWFALIGALGGVLLTSIAAICTAVLNHKWQAEGKEEDFAREQRKLLRQERREVYGRYLSAENRLYILASLLYKGQLSQKQIDDTNTAIISHDTAYGESLLLAGDKLRPVIANHYRFINGVVEKANLGEGTTDIERDDTYNRVLDVMREDITTSTGDF
jgi:hypothetical protein